MTLAASLAGCLRHQARNLARLGRGQPVAVPSFAAMTLDADDVAVAAEWLAERSAWSDDGVVAKYEKSFAAWNGSQAAFAFMSGREALSASLDALGIGAGDQVILPGYTCVVVPNALRYAGIEPVFADIELETFGADAGDVARRITPRTRAILIQHLYGLVCRDYDPLVSLAAERNLALIEDCAHATGAEYRGRKVGTRGRVAFYSSERSKVFCTITGGMAVTDDPDVAERLAAVRRSAPSPTTERLERQLKCVALAYHQNKHPQRWWRSDWAELKWGRFAMSSTTAGELRGERPPGYGSRMGAPIAAIGCNQLRKLDFYNSRRRDGAARWNRWCAERGIAGPRVIAESRPIFLRYPLLVNPALKKDRRRAERWLGAPVGRWFESQLHPAPGTIPGCPRATEAVARCINLPTLTA